MGSAYTALARGLDAAFWNPANLGLKDNPQLSINLISFGVRFGNSTISRTAYNLYSGKFLTQSDKESILREIPTGGFRLDAQSEFRLLSLSYHNFAIVINGEALASGRIAKDYIDLALKGNELGRKYSFTGTQAASYVISNAKISFGFPIHIPLFQEFAIGATLKYFQGFGFASLDNLEGTFVTYDDGIDSDGRIIARYSKGGSGFGANIGLVMVPEQGLTIGFVINNIFAQSTWSKEAQERDATYFTRLLTVENAEQDSVYDYENTKRKIAKISYTNPKYVRLGIAYEMTDWIITIDMALQKRQYSYLTPSPRMSFGAEYKKLSWILPRAGLIFGGTRNFAPAFGFGIQYKKFLLDLGFSYQRALLPFFARGATFSLSSKLLF